MDSLLPSEIARLVLGYLQEQKCEGAAKTFLETSPLLQECHCVAQRGGKYSTKVGGLSLIDILEKYCAVNAMVQEKLSRVTDSDTLRHCNDLLDQLRCLLDGSSTTRGHRFVVNISVPSQSSQSGPLRSPIISGSNRKRHHSSSERGKRISKSLSNMMDKNAQNTVTQSCDTVEATPLESLPGHKASTKQNDLESQNKIDSMMPASKISQFDVPSSSTTNTQSVDPNLVLPSRINVHSNYKDQGTESIPIIEPVQPVQTPSKCTAGTNTDELMNYCTAEVQTGPCDIIESESDINDEPIENLSILTKELLHRTELHERIAENINKAIMPVDTPLSEDNVCEHPTEANLSLLNDFDTTIKSIVQATETDPVFEDFLKEIFKVGETDTSPDEDSDGKNNKISNDENYPQNSGMIGADYICEVMEPIKLNEQKTDGSEIPLKQRLRSSSRSQNTNIDEEEKDTNSILENQNAEAIMSIVNVVTSKRNSLANSEEFNSEFPSIEPVLEIPVTYEPPPEAIVEPEVKKSEDKIKPLKSTTKKTKKPKPPKPIPEPPEVVPTLILCSEKEVKSLMQQPQGYIPIAPKPDEAYAPIDEPAPKIYLRTVNVPRHLVNPATIELSKVANPQILQMLQQQQQQQVGSLQTAVGDGGPIVSSVTSDQIVLPIVVTDEKHCTKDDDSTTATSAVPIGYVPGSSESTDEKHCAKDDDSTTATSAVPTGCVPGSSESITLYGGGGDAAEMKVSPISSMPIISLDDSTIGLTAGTGLSPFFKDHIIGGDLIEADSTKKDEEMDAGQMEVQEPAKELEDPKIVADAVMDIEDDCPEPVVLEVEPDEEELAANVVEEKPEEKQESVKPDNVIATEIIAKHTPRTLLRSRAKNNRLSLSTPRRRNSHVRALNFNTPMKHGTARKVPQSCTKSKSVCRASLFKSPPFTGATPNVNINLLPEPQPIVKKVRTIAPMKPIIYPQIPIATRSPAPKLQGNWAKYTGIGMILEETSTSESSPEKTPQQETASKMPSPIPELPEESIEKIPEKKAEDPCIKIVEKPVSEKKSWDSDLRKIVGAQVTEEESKPRTRNSRRASTRKKGSSAKAPESDAAGDSDAMNKTKDEKTTKDDKKTNPDSKNAQKTDDDNAKEPTDKVNTTVEVGTETAHKIEITPPSALPVSKKPHLEAPSVSKSNVENDKNVKNSTIPKNSPVNVMITRFSDTLDLETPRKTEVTFHVPPTPRLLVTPGDGLKINKSKVDLKIKDYVDTPDFPKTPCIVVTPKIIEEDKDKKPSPYYEPEDEQPAKFKEIVTEKVVMQVQETTTVTIQKNVIELQENKSIEITEYGVIEENMNQNRDEQTTSEDNSTMSKEIVEESSIEEANVSANSSANSYSDSDDDSSDSDSSSSSSSSNSSTSSTSSNSSGESSPTKSVNQEATEVASRINPELSPTKSVIQEATEVISKISPESSPTKSTIQELTEPAAQSSPESSPNESITEKTTAVTSQSFRKDLSMTESEINSPERLMQSFSNIDQEELDRLEAISRENSPTKMFSVTKEPLDDEVKETPAKNENMIEAMIGDTPSVTDAERALRRDSLTNLTSKISAIITTSQSDHQSLATSSAATSEESCVTTTGKSGLKIKSIEIVEPNDMTKKVSEMLHLGIQKNQRSAVTQRQAVVNNVVIDAKLSQQLEEKRLRMLAKLNGQKSPKVAGKGKRPTASKKTAETEKVVSSTTDNRKDKTKQQTESDKLVFNNAKNVEKNKSDNVKLADKKIEEVKESRKGKSKASPKKKTAQNDQLDKTERANNETNLKKAEKGAMKNIAKETSAAATMVTITAENVKKIPKSKVDQVKRDLFSDEEMNDQRTTRSQTARRTTNDGQKNSNANDGHNVNAPLHNSKEKLPGVLECLQLIPANKSDQESHDLSNTSYDNCSLSNSQSNIQEISFVYDESVPIKKRKRKYSTSELENTYYFTDPEDGITTICILTEYSELFKMTPKYVKPKASSSPKKSPTKVKKSSIKILEKPPISPIAASNTRVGKPDEKKKKVCKRKTTPNKEDRVVEKKTKVDPQVLFKKIKVDEFLKLVHE